MDRRWLYFKAALLGVFATSLAGTVRAAAQTPTFARVFSDHAVLQRDKPIRVWGSATPGSRVKVAIADASQLVKADRTGTWYAELPAMSAGGPQLLSVTDTDSGQGSIVNDVVLGDVWLCSGQSNMEFRVRESLGQGSVLDAPANPNIRLLMVDHIASAKPLKDMPGTAQWHISSPQTARELSAACFFMGRELQKSHDVPVGLITATWGGSWIQGWLTPADLQGNPAYAGRMAVLDTYARDPEKGKLAWKADIEAWWQKTEREGSGGHWQAVDLDDSDWSSVVARVNWQDTDNSDFKSPNGLYWYRTTLHLTPEEAEAANELSLGLSHGSDTTWVNGEVVGRFEGYGLRRIFPIHAGVFKPGVNVIAMRVRDNGGEGGPYTDPKLQYVKLRTGAAVPISGSWKYRMARQFDLALSIPEPPWTDRTGLSTLYNGMIAPLGPYGLKGLAWYQGESNIYDPSEYGRLLAQMRTSWRTQFLQKDLPFLVVQLPNYGRPSGVPQESLWAKMRDIMRTTAQTDTHSAYIVSLDIGDRYDIHPGQKLVLGQRLARAAEHIAYGKQVSPSGPRPVSAVREGGNIVVTFTDTDGGLVSYSADKAMGFQLCTRAGDCRFADAETRVDQIVIRGEAGAESVRYAWEDAPYVNLYSQADLPVPTFQIPISDIR